MAEIFSHVLGGPAMKAFWYHFAILFEALFILTAVDAGTRAGRFMLQDLIALAVPGFKDTKTIAPGIVATALTVAAWGFFLYQGVTDPLGGVNTLWPVFGISNQMLAAIALMLGTAVLFRMKRDRFAWVRSEEHTSELQSLMRISYAVFCLKKKKTKVIHVIHAYHLHQ